jgi:hypothetical protein
MLEYRELKIRISRDAAGGYRTYADGPTGTASGSFVAPYSSEELDDLLREISGQVGQARKRRVEAPDTARIKHFGGVLFDALFEDDLRDVYSASLRAVEDQGKGLRVTLSLKDAPELMLVPWEFLYDEPSFLSIQDSTPVVRYLDLKKSREPLQIVRPLRILGMVSSPVGVVELDVEREMQNIDRALARLKSEGAVDITWLENATLDELQICLREGSYHVFHYIGHGEYDEEQEDGVLLLEDDRGRADPVSGEYLGATLANHRPLRLATLNSCEGGRTADDDPFAGVATSLVQCQIPAVIAMQFEITDRMASVFSKWLYESLAAGLPVDQALSGALGDVHQATRHRVGDSGAVHACAGWTDLRRARGASASAPAASTAGSEGRRPAAARRRRTGGRRHGALVAEENRSGDRCRRCRTAGGLSGRICAEWRRQAAAAPTSAPTSAVVGYVVLDSHPGREEDAGHHGKSAGRSIRSGRDQWEACRAALRRRRLVHRDRRRRQWRYEDRCVFRWSSHRRGQGG